MGKVPFEKNTAIEETNEEVNTAENVKPKSKEGSLMVQRKCLQEQQIR